MRLTFGVIAVALLLGGCETNPYTVGSFVPGRIVSISDGKILPMQIELTYGSGKMTATDPTTGEVFDGTYTAINETKASQVSRPTFFGDQETGSELTTSDIAQGSAILVGNKGTVLNIKMQIKAGSPPHGFGEGDDNHGKKYNIQF